MVQVYPEGEWTPDIPFLSVVGVEVSSWDEIPEGLAQHTIPAGQYVKVLHKGPESQIGETYDAIREAGISAARSFDFEYWVDSSALKQEESTIEIYLPLEDRLPIGG